MSNLPDSEHFPTTRLRLLALIAIIDKYIHSMPRMKVHLDIQLIKDVDGYNNTRGYLIDCIKSISNCKDEQRDNFACGIIECLYSLRKYIMNKFLKSTRRRS
jgi:hypothetical protein